MMLSSEDVDSKLPIIAFADTEEGDTKVSARTIKELVDKGVNLSKIMKYAATEVNGIGGGHNIAAGATIPKGREEEFLEIIDKRIGEIIS